MSALLLFNLLGCSDVEDAHDHDHDHNHGVIEALELEFTAQSSGEAMVFTFEDDAGDTITLTAGESYDLTVSIYEEHGDMTSEVYEDGVSHQIFFLGDGVNSEATGSTDGVLTIAYADADADGLPIGLDNIATAEAAGTADLQVVLRHMPAENDVAIKTETSAAEVAAGGLSSIGGDNDADVTFSVTVE